MGCRSVEPSADWFPAPSHQGGAQRSSPLTGLHRWWGTDLPMQGLPIRATQIFKSHQRPSAAVLPWKSHLTSLSWSFLPCKMGRNKRSTPFLSELPRRSWYVQNPGHSGAPANIPPTSLGSHLPVTGHVLLCGGPQRRRCPPDVGLPDLESQGAPKRRTDPQHEKTNGSAIC